MTSFTEIATNFTPSIPATHMRNLSLASARRHLFRLSPVVTNHNVTPPDTPFYWNFFGSATKSHQGAFKLSQRVAGHHLLCDLALVIPARIVDFGLVAVILS